MNTDHSSEVSSNKTLLTVAYLETLPDDDKRYELIRGELFVSCAPGLPHQLVLQRLQLSLGNYLDSNPIGILAPGAGAVFSDYDSVIPDLVFVKNERWKEIVANDRFIAAPSLVIEVLSPGSANRHRDLQAKRGLYAKYGVEEYWVLDRDERVVILFCLREQILEETDRLHESDVLTSALLPGFALNIETLFDIPLP